MELHWFAISIVTIAEVVVALMLLLPLPASLKKLVLTWDLSPILVKATKVYLAVVAVLLGETLLEIWWSKPPTQESHEEFHHFQSNLLENQRNALVATLSLILFIAIHELCNLNRQNSRLLNDTAVLKKQATNISKEYMKMLDKETLDKTNNDSTKTNTNTSEPSPLGKLQEENNKLKAETEQLRKANEAIKKQAENQQVTFAKLQEENKSLQNKLQDFDIIFGEANKKQK